MRDDFRLESTYDYTDEEDWDDEESQWNQDEDEVPEEDPAESKDESKAYLEFLNDEAQKFSRLAEEDEDDLGEESVLLESPLDKIEPYQLFKGTLMSE